ncbi:hypothetical protein [Bacillus benzoevorans]|uniref:Uncharacterized protein n=1 Tax=Bacillus benzoevorans TaxID=1456 RepID=A0A7X0LXK0_9BACI|nr:hypothetical protein [Bacillus benzoevorans]MBB6446504.1 hypothetical protein [Bacillus benzoevorans]
MKLNVTVDIDWLNEDESLDEAIKKQIINSVVKKISDDVITSVKYEAEKKVQERVNELVDATYNEFLNGKVTLTDRWGDVTKKDVSIKNLIKDKCDKWLTEKVNDRGEPNRDSWGNSQTRMQYFIDKQISKQTKEMSNQIVTKVNQEMKKFITDSLKDSIGDKLVKEIGLEDLLKKMK